MPPLRRLIALLCIFAHLLAVFPVPARATVGTGVGCVFNAKNCGNIAQNAFLSAAMNGVQALGFNLVGDFKVANGIGDGSFVSTLLHGAVGGLGGAIMCGATCAMSGALGAMLGEIATGFDAPAQLISLLGTLASVLTGDTSASNGDQYNLALHQSEKDLGS